MILSLLQNLYTKSIIMDILISSDNDTHLTKGVTIKVAVSLWHWSLRGGHVLDSELVPRSFKVHL